MLRVKAATEITYIEEDIALNLCIRWSSSLKCTLRCSAENDQYIFSVGKLVRDRRAQSHGFSEFTRDGSVYPLIWHCKQKTRKATYTIVPAYQLY